MIEPLLPADVIAVEAFADIDGEPVYPGEERIVAQAVDRRREFVTARRCAREALAKLGCPPTPILSGDRGAPVWPTGIVGSITHCASYRAAAVGRADAIASIGIDAEPNEALPAGVLTTIALAEEHADVESLTRAHPSINWDRLLFSAKESVYKAWYPLTRRWLGFEDAELNIAVDTRTFTARLLTDGTRIDGGPALHTLTGRFLTGASLILTAVTSPRPAPSASPGATRQPLLTGCRGRATARNLCACHHASPCSRPRTAEPEHQTKGKPSHGPRRRFSLTLRTWDGYWWARRRERTGR